MRANENAQALPGTQTEQKLKDLEVHRNKSRSFLDKVQAQALPVQQESVVSSYTQEVVQSMRANENAQALPGTHTEQKLKDLEVHRNKSRGFLDKIQAQALPVQQELVVSSYTQEVVQSMRSNENAQALPGTQTEQKLKDLEVHRNKSRGFLDKAQAQALPVQQESVVSLKQRRKQKRNDTLWLLVSLAFLCTLAALHNYLEALARARFNSWYEDFGVTATPQDWGLLWRAGSMSTKTFDANVSTPTKPLKVLPTCSFFLDVSGLPARSPLPSRSLIIPVQKGAWQDCIEGRCRGLPPGYDQAQLVAFLSASSFVLDGKSLSQDYPLHALTNATIC